MARKKTKLTPEQQTQARDFVMARLAAGRAFAAMALAQLDLAIELFVDPSEDENGKLRAQHLEGADEAFTLAATAVQAAQEAFPEVDPAEGEEDPAEGEEDADEDAEDEAD